MQKHFKYPAAYNMFHNSRCDSSPSFRHLPHGVQMKNSTQSYTSLSGRPQCISVLLFHVFVPEDQCVFVESFICDHHFVVLDARLELSILTKFDAGTKPNQDIETQPGIHHAHKTFPRTRRHPICKVVIL